MPIIIRYKGPSISDCLLCPNSCLMDFSEECGRINIKSPKDIEEGNNVLIIKILLSMPFCIEYEHITPSKHNATKLCGNFHTYLNSFSFNNSLVILIKNLRKYNIHY